MALAYINKSYMLHAPTATTAESLSLAALADSENSHTDRIPLTSRILIVSVSGDLANQYIPVMNSIFAAQRKKIPIDIFEAGRRHGAFTAGKRRYWRCLHETRATRGPATVSNDGLFAGCDSTCQPRHPKHGWGRLPRGVFLPQESRRHWVRVQRVLEQ